jgi:hypothetical protein
MSAGATPVYLIVVAVEIYQFHCINLFIFTYFYIIYCIAFIIFYFSGQGQHETKKNISCCNEGCDRLEEKSNCAHCAQIFLHIVCIAQILCA